jgi:hypothetical protein
VGHLAQLVSGLPGWIAQTLGTDELDLAASGPAYSFEPTEKLLAMFDDNVAQAKKALREITGDRLAAIWSLELGERVVYSAPRGEAAT